jgi:hypothetical protein
MLPDVQQMANTFMGVVDDKTLHAPKAGRRGHREPSDVRILFSCHGAYEHFHPIAPMVLATQGKGHDVVVATGPELVDWVGACGLRAAPVGLSSEDVNRRGQAGPSRRSRHTGRARVPQCGLGLRRWQLRRCRKAHLYVVGWSADEMAVLGEGVGRAAMRLGIDPVKPITLLGVASLGEPDLLIEVDAVAVLKQHVSSHSSARFQMVPERFSDDFRDGNSLILRSAREPLLEVRVETYGLDGGGRRAESGPAARATAGNDLVDVVPGFRLLGEFLDEVVVDRLA